MDDSERRSLILVNPGLAPRARDRLEHHVHGLSAERRQRGDAAAPAFAERDPLRPDRQGQFHRRRRRGHHLRPGRHGADPERHLAQSRQRRKRAGGQSLGARPAAGRDAQRGPFRARLHRDGRRQAGQEEAADRDRAVRLLGAHLRLWRADAALRSSNNRGAGFSSPMYRLSLGDDARAARAPQGLGRRSLRGADRSNMSIR